MPAMIYLDYAATTPLSAEVEAAMRPFGREIFANPHSMHAMGRRAEAALDDARDAIADRFGTRAEEIIFTSGGTEADNLALKGVARAMRGRGNHIVTAAFEHAAVLGSCEALEREGFRVTYLPADHDGYITPGQVAEALTPETVLVSIMYANNEVGTIQPIAEIGQICRARRIPFHSDAVQAADELSLDVSTLQVDLLSVSAHKIYGPKGAGALYVRAGTRLQPLLDGGGQEFERRAGTENVAGMARAFAAVAVPDDLVRITELRDLLIAGLLAIPGSRLHGGRARRLANNVNVGFSGVTGEMLRTALDLEGICISTGAACSAGAAGPSHVLTAMGYPLQQALEAVRITLGRYTTEEEILRTIAATRGVVERLRRG